MRAAEFVQSYIDAWNHCDARAVAEHLVKNGTYCDIPNNEQHSREGLVASLVEFFTLEHHRYELIGEVLASEKSIAFQYKMSSVDSVSEEIFGAEFMTLKGDGAFKIADYYDPVHSATEPAVPVREKVAEKYAKSGLSDTQLAQYTEQLRALMDTEKAYLQSDLSMPELASRVNCSVNHLSQAVNSGFGMSFFDFLNSYRIGQAEIMLSRGGLQTPAILDVSIAVGFNSNSAFYAAFKKVTGKTPAQYRREFLANPQGGELPPLN